MELSEELKILKNKFYEYCKSAQGEVIPNGNTLVCKLPDNTVMELDLKNIKLKMEYKFVANNIEEIKKILGL